MDSIHPRPRRPRLARDDVLATRGPKDLRQRHHDDHAAAQGQALARQEILWEVVGMSEAARRIEPVPIPYREQAMGAAEAAKLFGLSPEWFLRTIACQPSFPRKVNARPATWIVGEVLDWRDAHRV
jgi:hypothetical protein